MVVDKSLVVEFELFWEVNFFKGLPGCPIFFLPHRLLCLGFAPCIGLFLLWCEGGDVKTRNHVLVFITTFCTDRVHGISRGKSVYLIHL